MYILCIILGIIAAISLVVIIIGLCVNDETLKTVGGMGVIFFTFACIITAVLYNQDMNDAREAREISALIDQTYHVSAHVDANHDTASFDYGDAHCVLRYVNNALHQWELTHPICAKEVSINP